MSFANREDSLQQCYGYGGAMECISSLQALNGLRIDYYADLTDQTLAAILDEVGELPYSVAEDIYRYDIVKYCPHGRPIVIEQTKKDIEKLFGRL